MYIHGNAYALQTPRARTHPGHQSAEPSFRFGKRRRFGNSAVYLCTSLFGLSPALLVNFCIRGSLPQSLAEMTRKF